MNRTERFALVRDELARSVHHGNPSTLRLLDLPWLDFHAQASGSEGRFGWLTPRFVDSEDDPHDVAPVSIDTIVDQTQDIPADLLPMYLGSISFYLYSHLTHLLEGMESFDERNALADSELLHVSDDYMNLVSYVQLKILDQVGAQ